MEKKTLIDKLGVEKAERFALLGVTVWTLFKSAIYIFVVSSAFLLAVKLFA